MGKINNLRVFLFYRHFSDFTLGLFLGGTRDAFLAEDAMDIPLVLYKRGTVRKVFTTLCTTSVWFQLQAVVCLSTTCTER